MYFSNKRLKACLDGNRYSITNQQYNACIQANLNFNNFLKKYLKFCACRALTFY